MPYWDHKRRRRKNCVSFFCDPYSHPPQSLRDSPGGARGKDSPPPLRSLRSESRGFFGLILEPSRKRNLYDIDSLAIIKSPLGQTNLRQSLI